MPPVAMTIPPSHPASQVGVPAGYTIESLWRSNTSGGDSASPAGEDVSADLTLRYRSPRNALESLQQAAIKAVDDWSVPPPPPLFHLPRAPDMRIDYPL